MPVSDSSVVQSDVDEEASPPTPACADVARQIAGTETELVAERVSELISSLRKHRHWSQERLARELDVSVNSLARWERGRMKISHPRMLVLALGMLDSIEHQQQ